MRRRSVLLALPLLALDACATAPRPAVARAPARGFADIGFATWEDDEPAYRLYPGDQLDIALPSAPELNRSVTVGPDGRISMPLIPQTMAADLATPQLEAALSQAYSAQLIDPRAEVSLKASVPIRVFVGGEVGKPGVYDMPGDIDALQSVIMAGGFLTSAEPHHVVVIRRGADGRPMMKVIDLGRAVKSSPRADATPLRRFDVVFVPRSAISNIGLFVQQYLRDVVPVQFTQSVGANSFLSTR